MTHVFLFVGNFVNFNLQWRPDQVGHWGTCPSGATLIKGRQKTGGAKMIDAHFFLCVKIFKFNDFQVKESEREEHTHKILNFFQPW